jgi:hypothetical protein
MRIKENIHMETAKIQTLTNQKVVRDLWEQLFQAKDFIQREII